MRRTYGNTWWGQQFLKALQSIDHSNRLPRGRSYANKGAVKEILVTPQSIEATVQGSRPRPYRQVIQFKPFTPSQKADILQVILDNPFLLSQLVNRELPPSLDEQLQAAHIHIFPRSWSDLKGTCSCPDYATPCKHLAAVIYLISQEIDKNPFWVFLLRGLDIIEELENRGLTASGAQKALIASVEHAMLAEPQVQEPSTMEEVEAKIDFSQIQPSRERIFGLLSSQTPFFPGKSFKKILDDYYKSLSKPAKKYSYPVEDLDTQMLQHVSDFQFFVDGEDPQKLQAFLREDTARTHPLTLDALLQEAHLTDALHQTPQLRLLKSIFEFIQHVLEKSTFVPQVVQTLDGDMYLRWLPAMIDSPTREIVTQYLSAFPSDWLCLETPQQKPHFLAIQEQFNWLFDALVKWLIPQLSYSDNYDLQPTINLFMGNHYWREEHGLFETADTIYLIQQWLSPFYLTEKDYVPLLQIEEKETSFDLHFAIEDKNEALGKIIPLADLFEDDTYTQQRLLILQDLALLHAYIPHIEAAIANKGKKPVRLDSEEFVQVLTQIIPVLELIGIRILLPKSLQKILKPQLSLSLDSSAPASESGGHVNMFEMLSFDWQVALGDQMISPKEFMEQVANAKGLVKIRDSYVLIDEKEMQALIKKLMNPPKMTEEELLQAAIAESYEGSKISLSEEVKKQIQELVRQEETAPPAALQATFRPYQLRGYSWLYKNDQLGFGSILADDMGLGKTLQVIGIITKLAEEKALQTQKVLIVVPTPLVSNWQREFEKFAPHLKVGIFHGPNRELDIPSYDAIVTTYGVARSDQKLLSKSPWRLLVIDEAQAIKNPGTSQTKALKKIKAQSRIAMSGTPVENRLSEYWSIFDFVYKGYLGSLKKFQKSFVEPIIKDRDKEQLKRFRAVTGPFILRRLKTDKSIISDLPEKISQNQICTLTPQQTALYEGVVDTMLKQIEENDGITKAGMVFKLITSLKQICNHPSHYLKKEEIDPTLSGKAQLLLNLLEQIRTQGEKVLIFTQYREMGELLNRLLATHFPEPPLFLHGGLSRKKRDHLVDTFQTQPYAWAFILSLKAAGTGLNLTAANHVVHYDLWWNPAVEAQATDRAFRIGQKKNVWVNRFITQNTFEEKINAMIQEKRELADLTVVEGEQWVGQLSQEELTDLFRYSGA
ncbi:MAG: DEAD/DEAH box helicase [Bacteroidota bacterium]